MPRDSSGFTLIELLVAVSVIVVTMVPMTSLFWSGLRIAATSSHRTDAFAIASREIESMRADPYALVGFYTDELAPQWKTFTTVNLGPCSTTCATPTAPLILPTGTTTPGPLSTGVIYSIARYVYWADAQGLNTLSSTTTFPLAYKGTTVIISWTDQAGTHSVEQDSIIYPGGQGVYAGPGGATTTSAPVSPTVPGTPILALAVTLPIPPLNQSEIDVVITPPPLGGAVAGYYVQWSTTSGFPSPAQSLLLPPTTLLYPIQNLAAGTTYFIRTFATNATGQSGYSNVVSGMTATATVTTTTAPIGTTTTVPAATTTTTQPCNLGAFTITTSVTGKTYLAKNGWMTENLSVNLNVNGVCLSVVAVTSVLHGTSTLDPGTPYVLVGLSIGGQWSVTVYTSGQAGWSVGTHDMTVLIGGGTTAVTHGLLVCAWTPPGRRSASANVC